MAEHWMEESQATGRVKQIFEEIKSMLELPFVPKLFRVLGKDPDRLEETWGKLKELFGSGRLDVKTKTMVALAVAVAQGSDYFTQIGSAALKRLGTGEEQISELKEVAELIAVLSRLTTQLRLEPEI